MKIVTIGAGNLAFHLTKALQAGGFEIAQVYSRTQASASKLAEELNVPYTTDIGCITGDASLFIISVSDCAIRPLVAKLPSLEGLVVHTAGSVPMNVFSGKLRNYGVLYPLQTFSKSHQIDFSEIPVFLEANTHDNMQILRAVAETISQKVYHASSDERIQLHLAAVFGCNFVNHLYHLSAQLAREAGFDFSVLSALLLETVRKALASESPNEVQTGPAARNDRELIRKHLDMLSSQPEWAEIYGIITKNIIKMKIKE